MEAVEFLTRWCHYLFGIAWIGISYYFGFVPRTGDATASGGADAQLCARVDRHGLLWLRHGALLTFLTGAVLFLFKWIDNGWGGLSVDVVVASVMATLMFLNVWLVIGPNASLVTGSRESVQAGGEAYAGADKAAAKAFLALRTNALLSAPMVLLMMTSAHFTLGKPHAHGDVVHTSAAALAVSLAIVALIEANAIWGRPGPVLNRAPVLVAASLVLSVVLAVVIATL